ncbi:MAG: hypothetical protein ABJC28_07475 [Acidobacteriota bacterium]
MPETRTPTASSACVACGAPRLSPAVCAECGELFDFPEDPFTLLGLTRSWSLDSAALEERYAELTRAVREKSAPRGDLGERVGQAVTALDAARRRLSDPVERAQYLLISYGGAEREKPLRKREFQSEVMEFEQAATNARQESDPARVTSVVLEAEEKLASAIMAAGQSFTRLERSLVEEVGSAADALAEARFWRRKVDELREVLGH